MNLSKLTLFSLLSITAAAPAFACDLCGCYTPRLEVSLDKPFSFYAGVAEQFTHLGTDRLNGDKVGNPTGQYLGSSTTQIVLGATFLDSRLAVQVNVPLIYRRYQRPEGFDIQRGQESGVGDVSLLASFVVFRTDPPVRESGGGNTAGASPIWTVERGGQDFSAALNLLAGMKFPTGDSSALKEEFNETEIEGAPESGIHGHDLALGTGSYDGIFGAQLALRYKALFFQADFQYAWRGQGHYSYRYANDFSWDGGPGVYFIRNQRGSLALQCVLSGETKGLDTFLGAPAEDTGITSLYLGPRMVASFGRVQGEVGLDLPVIMSTTAFQTTADYRIRAGLTIQF